MDLVSQNGRSCGDCDDVRLFHRGELLKNNTSLLRHHALNTCKSYRQKLGKMGVAFIFAVAGLGLNHAWRKPVHQSTTVTINLVGAFKDGVGEVMPQIDR